MSDYNKTSSLIEALTIFAKYEDRPWPTHCEHDTLYIMGIDKESVSEEDRARLEELGFLWDEDEEVWMSYRFGSA